MNSTIAYRYSFPHTFKPTHPASPKAVDSPKGASPEVRPQTTSLKIIASSESPHKPLIYQNLQPSLPSPSPKVRRFTSINWWDDLWNALTGRFIPSPEPKAFQMRDRFGKIWWYVYNPATGESQCFHSEDEVLHWLDQEVNQSQEGDELVA
jgi:hypothetical protein